MAEQALFDPITPEARTVKVSDIKPAETDGAGSEVGESLSQLGNISAPLLREVQEDEYPNFYPYEVIDGTRRIQEYQAAGIKEITALIVPHDVEVSDAQVAAMRAARNINRSPNPVQEAEAFAQMIEGGLTPQSISRHLGMDLATVRKRLRLLDLPAQLLEGVRSGDIAVSVGERMANMRPEDIESLTDTYESAGEVTGSDIRSVKQARQAEQMAELPEDMFNGADGEALAEQARQEVRAEFLEVTEKALGLGITVRELRDWISTGYNDFKKQG